MFIIMFLSKVDPGFPGVHQPAYCGAKAIIWHNFCQKCMKMKEIGPGGRL